jgi:hypothetical protein
VKSKNDDAPHSTMFSNFHYLVPVFKNPQYMFNPLVEMTRYTAGSLEKHCPKYNVILTI